MVKDLIRQYVESYEETVWNKAEKERQDHSEEKEVPSSETASEPTSNETGKDDHLAQTIIRITA